MNKIRLTMAQALVRYLGAQKVDVDGQLQPLFAGVWAIFGHGNVPALGEALYGCRETLPTLRGHCEQAMAHAAIAFAKQTRRRRMMACTSSIGPGATNMVTAAAVAHVNHLPVLFLPGETFTSRAPDPVLQQVEHPHDPNITANDCFRPVSRYFDRIVAPEQLITSLPRALAVLTDAELCGPVTICLPQDVQARAFDYPESFFDERVHRLQRLGADPGQLERVADMLRAAHKPVVVAGGGVHYSQAIGAFRDFVARHQLPVVETSAGKGALAWDDPLNAGAVGVVGVGSANRLVEESDLVIAVGSRLSDFTTGSRTGVSSGARAQVNINVGHFDANKHAALALRGDAGRALHELEPLLGDWRSDGAWVERVGAVKSEWLEEARAATAATDSPTPSDAQVTAVIDRVQDPQNDVLVIAAGSMPAEGAKLWRAGHAGAYHSEYGYSCMGYEIAGGIGVKMAQPEAEVFVVVGDGSYLMLNSEIATSVMLGHKLIIVVLDNRGFGCINRLQQMCGGLPFNNLLANAVSAPAGAPAIDFAAHARSLGAEGENVVGLTELEAALQRARAANRTYVIALDTNPVDSTGGGTWWEVGVPEVSAREDVEQAHREWMLAGKKQQAF
jgi:3D-(3,5/4)-trihydroxycyclohexane-1,2-dione acylhydrolase (decyclizing)